MDFIPIPKVQKKRKIELFQLDFGNLLVVLNFAELEDDFVDLDVVQVKLMAEDLEIKADLANTQVVLCHHVWASGRQQSLFEGQGGQDMLSLKVAFEYLVVERVEFELEFVPIWLT